MCSFRCTLSIHVLCSFFLNNQACQACKHTAIPLPIKLYVALRVGVAVILSQRPTPGTIDYSTNRFCGETHVLAGVLKSQDFKLCFGAKSFVLGKKLAKLRKEEDR